ncbi:thioesterase family protein [Ottowia sp.]|nr:thioesterase family protein [Ottowia sp.]MBK6614393.1 thioesterase family protein [Ottowia sp.]MBK6745053.1 thioesterase family protein [Ottowia sp.]
MGGAAATERPFDDAVALARPAGGAPGQYVGRTSPAYANMVGPFGGITAAQALQAIWLHPDRLGEPVAFTGNFAAALADGEFTIDAQPVRTNRSTQHWVLTTRQRDAEGRDSVVYTATAMTALRRDTWRATDAVMPDAPAPESVPPTRRVKRPAWLDRYDMRWFAGAMPLEWNGAEGEDSVTRLWVRDEPPRALDFASLTALCDVFFPRVWLRRARMTPIGTVSMTVYFHASAADLAAAGTGHLLGQARGHAFHDGYFDQSAEMWSAAGRLLATTHQVVYYKE